MQPGDVLAERFELAGFAGGGGMGRVFRATDRRTGELAAIKLGTLSSAQGRERFLREARVLSKLSHPGVVRYLAHGGLPDGSAYLAMEWIDGVDLAGHLRGRRLAVPEAVGLVRRVADAVGHAHEAGIVHRDIKPDNVLLVGGRTEAPKLIDFGVARVLSSRRRLTREGAALGTPQYMSPEQARGDPDVDARADVFSLGCLLYQCLTRRPPFAGDSALAVMVKILLEEARRPGDLRRGIPDELDALVARLMDKDPAMRPWDGRAVAVELGALPGHDARRPRSTMPPALSAGEQRLVSVVVAAGAARGWVADEVAPTIANEEYHPVDEALRQAVTDLGADLLALGDGSVVACIVASERATDAAVRACRVALEIRRRSPRAPVAVATGRAQLEERLPTGEAIDRAAALAALPVGTITEDAARLDDVTAGLLGDRLEVAGDAHGLLLVGDLTRLQPPRRLLGKPAPCVGRERDLAALVGILEECVAEPVARAVLVTGQPGVGKSRVLHELLTRVPEGVEVWSARGNPLGGGSSFGLVGQLVSAAASLKAGEPLELRQRKLRARVCRHVPPDDVEPVTLFLGELVGAPFPEERSVLLASARRSPALMGEQIRRAFTRFVAAEVSHDPVVLVLDDLQWGDLPSVTLLDDLLRTLEDAPLLLLALARPEAREVFPELWPERGLQEVRLLPLTRRAAEKLIRGALPDADDDAVGALIARGAGNPLFLEELVRAHAAGHAEAPATVLAMVQTRLESLAPAARRVLRAASVLGRTFWRGALPAMLGEDDAAELEAWLAVVADAEVVQPQPTSRLAGEEAWSFRHDVVREAAYATLTERDRALGHRLAGRWLEQAGETDAVILAEHHLRGGEPARAVGWFRRAAEHSLDGQDLASASEYARRGIEAGARGPDRAALRLLQARVHRERGEYGVAAAHAADARDAAEPGSATWFSAASELAFVHVRGGDPAAAIAVAEEIERFASATTPGDEARIACAQASDAVLLLGELRTADHLLSLAGRGLDPEATNPIVLARLCRARGMRWLFAGDLGRALEQTRRAVESSERAGDRREATRSLVNVGYAYLQLGDDERAAEALRRACEEAERQGLSDVLAAGRHNLGWALARLGEHADAIRIERLALQTFADGDARMEAGCRQYLAAILVAAGDLEVAEVEARAAIERAGSLDQTRIVCLGVLAEILRRRGRADEALAAAREAVERLEEIGGLFEESEARVRLSHAEALSDTGDEEGARRAIVAARDHLVSRAERITDPSWRASFLERVPENARTLALHAAWVGG